MANQELLGDFRMACDLCPLKILNVKLKVIGLVVKHSSVPTVLSGSGYDRTVIKATPSDGFRLWWAVVNVDNLEKFKSNVT